MKDNTFAVSVWHGVRSLSRWCDVSATPVRDPLVQKEGKKIDICRI